MQCGRRFSVAYVYVLSVRYAPLMDSWLSTAEQVRTSWSLCHFISIQLTLVLFFTVPSARSRYAAVAVAQGGHHERAAAL